MIKDFLMLRAQISAKTQIIGGMLRGMKFHACKDLEVPCIQHEVAAIHADHVDIKVGYNGSGTILARIPVHVFECTDPELIKLWITDENNRMKAQTAEAIRSRELKLLRELCLKYPDDVCNTAVADTDDDADTIRVKVRNLN